MNKTRIRRQRPYENAGKLEWLLTRMEMDIHQFKVHMIKLYASGQKEETKMIFFKLRKESQKRWILMLFKDYANTPNNITYEMIEYYLTFLCI